MPEPLSSLATLWKSVDTHLWNAKLYKIKVRLETDTIDYFKTISKEPARAMREVLSAYLSAVQEEFAEMSKGLLYNPQPPRSRNTAERALISLRINKQINASLKLLTNCPSAKIRQILGDYANFKRSEGDGNDNKHSLPLNQLELW